MNCTNEEAALKVLKGIFERPESLADNGAVDPRVDLEGIAADIRARAASDETGGIPPHICGAQRQYLEAVRDNAVAMRKSAQAVAATQKDNNPRTSRSRVAQSSILGSHLELLRQEKLHSDLSIIRTYVAELDTLSEDASGSMGSASQYDSMDEANCRTVEIDTTHEKIRGLICKLESAVLEADSRANLERSRLHSAQQHAEGKTSVDIATQLRALSAVRDELTAWIEESLAACASVSYHEEDLPTDNDTVTPEIVQGAYDRYINTRSRLLKTSSAFSSVSQPQMGAPRPPEPPTQESRHTPTVDDKVFQAERKHLVQQSQVGIRQVQDYSSHGIDVEEEDASSALHRLTDESQLLPQYPMLSKSEKFSKLVNQLGPASTLAKRDQVTEQVASWAFAADAAEKATSSILQAHQSEADVALDEADQALQHLTFLQAKT